MAVDSEARRHRSSEQGQYQHGSKWGALIQHREQESLLILTAVSQMRKRKHFPNKHRQEHKGRERRPAEGGWEHEKLIKYSLAQEVDSTNDTWGEGEVCGEAQQELWTAYGLKGILYEKL